MKRETTIEHIRTYDPKNHDDTVRAALYAVRLRMTCADVIKLRATKVESK